MYPDYCPFSFSLSPPPDKPLFQDNKQPATLLFYHISAILETADVSSQRSIKQLHTYFA
jgi:hypothetical protein